MRKSFPLSKKLPKCAKSRSNSVAHAQKNLRIDLVLGCQERGLEVALVLKPEVSCGILKRDFTLGEHFTWNRMRSLGVSMMFNEVKYLADAVESNGKLRGPQSCV